MLISDWSSDVCSSDLVGGPYAVEVADDPVIQTVPLGFQWPTIDPFLFCVHHDDAYPPVDDRHGPAVSLEGRVLGQDFEGLDGWRMYHGPRTTDVSGKRVSVGLARVARLNSKKK